MLYLQKAKPQNASKWLRLVQENRQELEYWMPHLKEIRTIEDAQHYINKNAQVDFYLAAHIYEMWTTNALIGLIALHSGCIQQQRVALSYWLGKTYRGKGFATRACQLLISKTFVHFPIQTLCIDCQMNNQASQAVAVRLGFLFNSQEGDILHFEMHRKKWMEVHYDRLDLLGFLEEIDLPE
ncbi:GNAT family N-acetyltransferase [Aureispira anguillae]|uniref:GNAT family N-acetyltransferase n=1 Tax=Aureispira anguillae TaxID=2864201 RepID=A0A915YIH7_9BACT|nr:GNAT family N-acetyltransferase [Aureispira anguillae]BDS13817.1 GNAT family N-acetyltransferase [Aureispira anguillae]